MIEAGVFLLSLTIVMGGFLIANRDTKPFQPLVSFQSPSERRHSNVSNCKCMKNCENCCVCRSSRVEKFHQKFHPFRVELRLRVPALIARCIKKVYKKRASRTRGPDRHKATKNSARNVRNGSKGQKYSRTRFTSGKKDLHSNNDYSQPDKETCGSYPPQTNKKSDQFSTEKSCLKRKLSSPRESSKFRVSFEPPVTRSCRNSPRAEDRLEKDISSED